MTLYEFLSEILRETNKTSGVMPAKKLVQQARSVRQGSRLQPRLQPGWGHLTELQHIITVIQQNDSAIVFLMPYQPPCSMPTLSPPF